MTNFIAACIGYAELLSFFTFGVYAFGPIIWELMQ